MFYGISEGGRAHSSTEASSLQPAGKFQGFSMPADTAASQEATISRVAEFDHNPDCLWRISSNTVHLNSVQEVLRCLLDGIPWLLGPDDRIKITGRSDISQARTRLGAEPLVRLHDEVVAPIGQAQNRGSCYRGWRVVSMA